jgi:hypothetical protein
MLALFRLLCLLLLVVAAGPAGAQTAPPTPAPTGGLTYRNFDRADTARAVRRLFRSRRGGGAAWLALGVAGTAGATLPALQSTSAGVWTPGVVAGAGLLVIGLNKRIQFRKGRERKVLRELAATGHLRPSVERRLQGKFEVVKGAESDYNPLLAKDIAPASYFAQLTPEQAQALARADTLRAITRLYERHQRSGKLWAATASLGVLSLVRAAVGSTTSSRTASSGELAGTGAGVILLPAALSVYHFIAFSEQKQDEAESNYRAGQHLPKQLRRHIRRRDMQPFD